jgi:hypothetical protein
MTTQPTFDLDHVGAEATAGEYLDAGDRGQAVNERPTSAIGGTSERGPTA